MTDEQKISTLFTAIKDLNAFSKLKESYKHKEKLYEFLLLIEETAKDLQSKNPTIYEMCKTDKVLLTELYNTVSK